MPKTLTAAASSINPRLIALTPRQVLLANPTMTAAATNPSSLSDEDRTLLHRSIAHYFQKLGFSKSLKKFRSEAHLKEDGGKDSKLDLEEVCRKFLDKGTSTVAQTNGLVQEGKKKKQTENSKNAVADQSVADDKPVIENITKEKRKAKKSSDAPKDVKEPGIDAATEVQNSEVEKKRKDKKKKKDLIPETISKEEDQQTETLFEAAAEKSQDLVGSKEKNDAPAEVEKKSRDKKKKSKTASTEVVDNSNVSKDAEKSVDVKKAGLEGETISSETSKENKPQKRKRLESEEKESQPNDKEEQERTKRRKKDSKTESRASEKNSEVKTCSNGEIDPSDFHSTPSKQLHDKENGDDTAEKTTGKHSKKQYNGSTEPKSTTVKAFQRVKIDEVEFADDRLKDNSYWAKDGAEIGYGAKAQEVLGQVRGRGFRHEKTKKKRGSYRGGQIDLQSHSVKFNYDDEE